jgi:hypothetical protein
MVKDAVGQRHAVCKSRKCPNYKKEFTVPTADMVMRLLKLNEGENEK